MSLVALENVAFGYRRDQKVLHDVSLTVTPGTNVGLVGESGSGKSTIVKLLLGLERATTGQVTFDGEPMNLSDGGFMRRYRRSVQAVFQDPYSSLDPRHPVEAIVGEPLRSLRIAGDHRAAIVRALKDVDLPADALRRYPHEFSGGQRQRVAIARAIVARPDLVLADEAVSALDLSTRIRIVELLRRLSGDTTFFFISHDLGVVAALCEDIIILERGRIVESGSTREILSKPQHPYTQRLLESVPRMPV